MKEPWQLWAEVCGYVWSSLDDEERALCASNEAAVRADERAKCERAVRECRMFNERMQLLNSDPRETCAAAIRNLGESKT